MQAWLSPLLSDIMPKWLNPAILIQKADIHFEAWYWLSFMCKKISHSKNKSILMSPPEILFSSIITKNELNLGSLKVLNIASYAQQKQNTLSFMCMNTKLSHH